MPQLEKPRFHRRIPGYPDHLGRQLYNSAARNRKVSAAMAHSPPSSSCMAVAVGCMHGNADLRVNGIVPRPPRDHAVRIRISGLPALLDRGPRKIDVARIALAVE